MNMMRSIALIACFAASGVTAAVPRAEQAWNAGDYTGAFALAAEAAENGDVDAQFLLAEAYRQGKGTYTNLLAAEVWYFRAAQQGHVVAAAELGAIYAGERRTEEARHWLRFAADRGDLGAQGSLAALLFNSPENDQEQAEALALMTKAAARGSDQAKIQLARMQAARGIVAAPASVQASLAPPVSVAAASAVTPKAPVAPASVVLAAAAVPAPVATAALAPALTPIPHATRITAAPAALKLAETAALPLVALDTLVADAPKPILVAANAPQRVWKVRSTAYVPVALRKRAPLQPQGLYWRVQVGAFRSPAAARKAWSQLSLRVSALRSENLLISRMGTLLRVQTGAGSYARAMTLCRTIRDAHWPCFVSSPRSLRAQTIAVNFSDDTAQPGRQA